MSAFAATLYLGRGPLHAPMSESSTAAASKSEALDGIIPFSLSSGGGVGGAGSWVVSHARESVFQKEEQPTKGAHLRTLQQPSTSPKLASRARACGRALSACAERVRLCKHTPRKEWEDYSRAALGAQPQRPHPLQVRT